MQTLPKFLLLLTRIYSIFFNVVSSKLCVGPLTVIRISFFLLLTCTDILISTPNIITSLTILLPSDNEKLSYSSNPIPFPEYLHLSKSSFLVNLKATNKSNLM